MHELTLCESLLDMLDEERRRRRFSSLRRIKLEIGRLGCVDPDALLYAFEVSTRGSWLDGTAVEVDRLPGRARCLDCDREVEIADRLADCPGCHGSRLLPVGGDEIRLVEIEVTT